MKEDKIFPEMAGVEEIAEFWDNQKFGKYYPRCLNRDSQDERINRIHSQFSKSQRKMKKLIQIYASKKMKISFSD